MVQPMLFTKPKGVIIFLKPATPGPIPALKSAARKPACGLPWIKACSGFTRKSNPVFTVFFCSIPSGTRTRALHFGLGQRHPGLGDLHLGLGRVTLDWESVTLIGAQRFWIGTHKIPMERYISYINLPLQPILLTLQSNPLSLQPNQMPHLLLLYFQVMVVVNVRLYLQRYQLGNL